MEDLLYLLKMVKEKKITGDFIEIALGKNKFPETISEGFKMFKQELWQRK